MTMLKKTMTRWRKYCLAGVGVTLLCAAPGHAETSVTRHGVTWSFDQDYPTGEFVNGDPWVVGPVQIIGIHNDYHTHGFSPRPDQDGSMINPPATTKQGYDGVLKSYDASLNASHPGGEPIAQDNPLALPANASLISTVSWLYESEGHAEPGIPRFNGGTKAPRPVLRAASILTCLDAAPPEGSFRPSYCGDDKSPRFNRDQLDLEKLKDLKPVAQTPDLAKLERSMERLWIDHVHEYLGAMVHPSDNMPEYGRELSIHLGEVALMLNLDFAQLPGSPTKDKLVISYVQLGIDLAGIADAGGSWPSNGGHHAGRKLPILIAGVLLGDQHMSDVGQWDTGFQEDLDTFYVSQAEINMTASSAWKPDKRAPALAYGSANLGMPEWGIVHVRKPKADNMEWSATYRDINNQSYVGFVLAARIMGLQDAWNHQALFDYIDRSIANGHPKYSPDHKLYARYVFGGDFVKNMWQAYRADTGHAWTPADPTNLYSTQEFQASD